MIEAVKRMYNVNALVKVPFNVMQALEDADNLCKRLGTDLLSVEVIASIIVKHDTLRCYDEYSPFYIGYK